MMADNRVRTAVDFMARELSGIYPPGEVRSMTRLAFEHYFALSPTDLVLKAESTLTESELLKVLHVVRELRKERPIQYILGEAWFDGLCLKVGPEVLIPRPETEELVAWLEATVQAEGLQAPRMLDIGTGSGCIPLALKQRMPAATLTAWDVSEAALALARQNGEALRLDVHWQHRDALAEPDILPMALDVLVSNPPYVTPAEKAAMPANVLDHEPHLALFTPANDPLVFFRAIGRLAQRGLKPGGFLFFELNQHLGNDTCALLSGLGFRHVTLRQDLQGNDRMIRCQWTGNSTE